MDACTPGGGPRLHLSSTTVTLPSLIFADRYELSREMLENVYEAGDWPTSLEPFEWHTGRIRPPVLYFTERKWPRPLKPHSPTRGGLIAALPCAPPTARLATDTDTFHIHATPPLQVQAGGAGLSIHYYSHGRRTVFPGRCYHRAYSSCCQLFLH